MFASESSEGEPALAAGIDRGAEILAVRISEADLKPVSELLASGGPAAFSRGARSSDRGREQGASDQRLRRNAKRHDRQDRVQHPTGLLPLRRKGDRRRRQEVGYVNLRTFISTADPQLRNAFAQFKAQGSNQVIVDFRYNSGGLIATGVLLNNLLLGQRTAADAIQFKVHRASKSVLNAATNFSPQPESIAAMKIAFIGTGATASVSEMVMNAVLLWARTRL